MEASKILVVDDEEKIVEVIKSYLEHAGYTVYTAFNGRDALSAFDRIQPALVVLDLMLPDISGEVICATLRKKSRVSILMLTAKVDEESILNGLSIGADDYITKPFSPRQFVARVSALLRRNGDEHSLLADQVSYNQNELTINFNLREVRKNGVVVSLTLKEYSLLYTLIKYSKKIFTREELISCVMGADYDGFDRTIDTHIKNLRQKIETDPKTPVYVKTVHGVGYKFGGDQNEI